MNERNIGHEGVQETLVSISRTKGGDWGLFALKDIPKGTQFVQLHKSSILTPSHVNSWISTPLPEVVTEWGRLAMFIVLESRKKECSEWWPYLSCLPRKGSVQSTIFWTEAERELLPKSVQDETEERIGLISEEYTAVVEVYSRQKLTTGTISLEEFSHAYAVVSSRAWHIEQLQSIAMAPYVDMLNHDPRSASLLMFDEEKQQVEVLTDRDFEAGSEIFISYGEHPNTGLVIDFGFVVPNNPYDSVDIQLSCESTIHLKDRKEILLRKFGLLGDSPSSTVTLKHAGKPSGQGLGIPHTLRAWGRVMSAETEKDLLRLESEAVRNHGRLGRRPLRREGKEAIAMSFLLNLVENLLVDNQKSLKVVEQSVKDGAVSPGRGFMLSCVYEGQLSVLQSAAAWFRPRSLNGGLDEVFSRSITNSSAAE